MYLNLENRMKNLIFNKVTAIILAGGKSTRMKNDKLLLPIRNVPMIQHIYDQLKNYFNEILVSSNNSSKYSFLNANVIIDKKPDCGPLMGIASAMEASSNDINFIIAGDIPKFDNDLLFNMVKISKDFDGVVPINLKNQFEPLFAIYKKKMLKSIFNYVLKGKYKIIDILKNFNIKYIKIKELNKFININNAKDYSNYLNSL